jgi:NAD(P)-dependent dehydrogenase (short-subunit alcohol dehydrogenase family)
LKGRGERTIAEFGHLDILVNNEVDKAAGTRKRTADVLEFDPVVFQEMVQVNVLARFWAPSTLCRIGWSAAAAASCSAPPPAPLAGTSHRFPTARQRRW